MSALTGCRDGGLGTNLIDPDNRYDIYTDTTDKLNEILAKYGIKGVTISRKDAKNAMMTACYGSSRQPKEIFGELVEAFEMACMQTAKGAFSLLPHLINAWTPFAESHEFVMPDLHHVYLPSESKVQADIEINEIKHRFTTYVSKIVKEKRKVSLAAHFTHATDSYLLRTVLRRTNFNTARIKNANKLMNTKSTSVGVSKRLDKQIEAYQFTGIADVSVLSSIGNQADANALPTEMKNELITISDSMLHYGSFETLTVHDAFRVSPVNANALRYAYKESLAQLADSHWLDDWFIQVTGSPCPLGKLTNGISKYIRNSNYSIC